MAAPTEESTTSQAAPEDEGVVDEAKQKVEEEKAAAEAEEQSLGTPTLLEGQRVVVEDAQGMPRMAYVTGHVFATVEDQMQFQQADNPYRFFGNVEGYVVRTRDSRNELLTVPADKVTPLSTVAGWGRGQAPEPAEGEEHEVLPVGA